MMETRKRCGTRMVLCAAAMLLLMASGAPLHSQVPSPSPQVQPRSGAGYVAGDGHIQVIACSCMGETVNALNALFVTTHPGTSFNVRLGDNYSAMAALTFDRTAYAAMGSEYTRIGLGDNLKITAPPVGMRVAHASLTPGTAVPALAIIVNSGNPLAALTMDQLARIFTVSAPGGDIAVWEQAGVEGPLADREIHLFGPPSSDYFDSDDPQVGEFLSTDKFGGLNFTHGYQALTHYADVVNRVRQDPSAIGITAANVPLAGVKVVALKRSSATAAASPSVAEIAAGRYPLDRYVYIYLRSNKGIGLDPFSAEFARSALSSDGQRAIAAGSAGYLPLNEDELAEERAKLSR
jgi:phosphate transport system substrate-binding protein